MVDALGEASLSKYGNMKRGNIKGIAQQSWKRLITEIHESGDLNVITLIPGILEFFEPCKAHG